MSKRPRNTAELWDLFLEGDVVESSVRARSRRSRGSTLASHELLDSFPVGLQVTAPSGLIRYTNSFQARLHGYEPGELVGQHIEILVAGPEERAWLRRLITSTLRTEVEPEPFLCIDVRKDGREVAVRVDWSYWRHGSGHIAGFSSVVTPCERLDWNFPARSSVRDALVALSRLERIVRITQAGKTCPQKPAIPMSLLSPRERDVLARVLRSHNPQEVAEELDISVNTVRNHLKNVYRKLGVHSREELFAQFVRPDEGRR